MTGRGPAVTVCAPVAADGTVDPRFGRAERVGIAEVRDRQLLRWTEVAVGWGELHDQGPQGAHHARVIRFLREHGVQVVLADHLGPGMQHSLQLLGVQVQLGATGNAQDAVRRMSP